MALLFAPTLWLTVAACAASPTPEPTTTAIQSAHAETTQGPFKLTLELPKATWGANEPITGRATLLLVGEATANVGGSGLGLIAFAFVEVGGRRHMEAAWTADCRSYRLEAGRPMTSGITKSGGFTADDPDAAFYRAFFSDPLVHLPAGDWQLSAVASFVDGADCSGQSHLIRASLLVHVVP